MTWRAKPSNGQRLTVVIVVAMNIFLCATTLASAAQNATHFDSVLEQLPGLDPDSEAGILPRPPFLLSI
jgi:hypothetical protein